MLNTGCILLEIAHLAIFLQKKVKEKDKEKSLSALYLS
jgi:hypothetical protein